MATGGKGGIGFNGGFKYSHEDARQVICSCCGIKTSKKTKMTDNDEALVRKYCKPSYDSTLREQPAGLCNTCRWYLFACKRRDIWVEVGKPDPRVRWDAFELEHRRFSEKDHNRDDCQICILAKENPVQKNNPEMGHMLQPREPLAPEKKEIFKLCGKCYQHIGRGIPHCCTVANLKKNLANIVSQLSPKDQGHIVSECVKNLASTSGAQYGGGVGNEMKLNGMRGGNKLSVTVGKAKESSKPTAITTGFMASLQKKLNCSEKKLLMVAKEFRQVGVTFEPHIREELQILSHSLDEFYKVEKLEFVGRDENKEVVPVQLDLVYVEDLESFVTHVTGERELDAEQVIIRVGLDGGQGSFKVVASIFELNAYDKEIEGAKLTGSNKLLVFAMAEELEENYDNVRIVVEKLRLNEIGCCYAADLKLINCMLGISSHGGKHACPYCESDMSLTLGTLRTFRNLNDWHQKILDDAAKSRNPQTFIKRNQKHYMNVVNKSMIVGEPDSPILFSVPLPELHLMMGLVNWAVTLLYKQVNKENLQERMRTKSISVHGYHGGGLDGVNSSNFLKHLDFIFEPFPAELTPVHTMLTKFRKVVDSCFGMELSTTFKEDIDEFNNSVHFLIEHSNNTLKIKLEPTWKIHILVVHLKPFLEEKMTALGVFCEQTSEASHCVMKPTTQRFKRRSDHRDHGPKLFRAVTDFSSKNM